MISFFQHNGKNASVCVVLLALTLGCTMTWAHGRYVLPSHTSLSANLDDKNLNSPAQAVAFTASITNDIFHPDKPLADDGKGNAEKSYQPFFKRLKTYVTQPDGERRDMQWRAFSRFSASDLVIKQEGSYRVTIEQLSSPMTTYRTADGQPARAFGPKPKLPEGAKDITRLATASRVETFITMNTPSNEVLKPAAEGLSLGGPTHPNDLFAQEPVVLSVFFDGAPMKAGREVHITPGGTRHRNDREEIIAVTNDKGEFTVTFPRAGFYHLEAAMEVAGEKDSGIDVRHNTLYVTLEVFPQ